MKKALYKSVIAPPPQVTRGKDPRAAISQYKSLCAFTLPELLIAVAIFSFVAVASANMYVGSFRTSRSANDGNQLYSDARYIMRFIGERVKNGMIDYDEYYNQLVVLPLNGPPPGGPAVGADNYGQNYGRYYSSFFYPGGDRKLGFDCSPAGLRNGRNCIPNRQTLDRHTGQNPYPGKYQNAGAESENAFCSSVSYTVNASGQAARTGACLPEGGGPLAINGFAVNELYLISQDAGEKTILARERTNPSSETNPVYALSILKLNGQDTNNDGVPDAYVCAPEFQCRGADEPPRRSDNTPLNTNADVTECLAGSATTTPAELPRRPNEELVNFKPSTVSCDSIEGGVAMSRDFVPISPLRVNITNLRFIIEPLENPYYAFAEEAVQQQPRVTVSITIQPAPKYNWISRTPPLTLVETFSTRLLNRIPAPLLVAD